MGTQVKERQLDKSLLGQLKEAHEKIDSLREKMRQFKGKHTTLESILQKQT